MAFPSRPNHLYLSSGYAKEELSSVGRFSEICLISGELAELPGNVGPQIINQ